MEGWQRRWAARAGLAGSLLLWAGSILALMAAVQANETAGLLGRGHGGGRDRIAHLHGVAVMWAVVMAGLQIGAMVVGTGILRVGYRLRTAVCFAISVGALVMLNAAWLLGLLVWLRMYGDTR